MRNLLIAACTAAIVVLLCLLMALEVAAADMVLPDGRVVSDRDSGRRIVHYVSALGTAKYPTVRTVEHPGNRDDCAT